MFRSKNLVFWCETLICIEKLSISNWKTKFFDHYTEKPCFSIKHPEITCLCSQRCKQLCNSTFDGKTKCPATVWIALTLGWLIVSGGMEVKILEVVDSSVGLKSANGGLESAVARQNSHNSVQLSQIETSHCDKNLLELESAVDSRSSCYRIVLENYIFYRSSP